MHKKGSTLKKILRMFGKKKGLRNTPEPSITGLWLWTILGSCIVTLVLLGWSSLLFVRAQNAEEETVVVNEIEGVTTIDREELDTMLEFLKTQRKTFDAASSGSINLVDPSL